MSLQLRIAQASEQGPRERNEDFSGFVTPTHDVLVLKGALLVLADGVSGGGFGREAAEICVRNLLSDYYATPDTWQVGHSLRRLLQSINSWLYSQSLAKHAAGGMSCTLSALVCQGRRFTIAHVGDSRVYRVRDGVLSNLTQDHVWDAPNMSHVLKRAVGLDELLQVDIVEGELQAGDRFLICCDGIWSALTPALMTKKLVELAEPEQITEQLVKLALEAGSQDNCTAVVVCVDDIDSSALLADWRSDRLLAVPPKLSVGARLDEFVIEALLHESRQTRLYQAKQVTTGQVWIIKTRVDDFEDANASEALLLEEWMGKRIQSHYFAEVLPLSNRSFLYFAQRAYIGSDIGKLLAYGHFFSSVEVVKLGIRLLKGLAALHRLDILHRDIKPDNLHLDQEGKLRILDLGVATCSLCEQLNLPDAQRVGTPSFLAPELFVQGEKASVQTDLYAAGVTLYYMLTRHYPYGEVEPFQTPKFTEPKPASRYQPSIPAWLDTLLLKAVSKDVKVRFETAEEFLLALEKGEHHHLARMRPMPLIEKDPKAFWQGIALISMVVNLLLIYLLKVS